MYKSLCEYISSFILDKHLEMEWLSYVVGVCVTFSETAKLFSKVVVPFAFFQQGMGAPVTVYIFTSSWYGQSLVFTVLIDR